MTVKILPAEVRTLEDLLDLLKPKTVFIAYEGFSKKDMPSKDNPYLTNEMEEMKNRISSCSPNINVTCEAVYSHKLVSTYFCNKWKYVFANPKAKWEESVKADLSLIFTWEGKWILVGGGELEPYTEIGID